MNTLEMEVKHDKLRVYSFLKREPLTTGNRSHRHLLQIHGVEIHPSFNYETAMNDIADLNGFLREVNASLEVGSIFSGYFIDCKILAEQRRAFRIPLAGKVLKAVDFTLHRVLPKTKGFRRIYTFFSKGKNRRISKAEMLGRLVYAGFDILDVDVREGKSFFRVTKSGDPLHATTVSEGWIYRMPRVGKNGKMIHVFKFRTMHPYSEFLQDYLKQTHGYGANGKIANDYRMTSWGKFLRRYWLDEVPQLINVLKGDMKIVGVRPISVSYFNDIPEDLQQLRLRHKPGCVPPYVAMNRASSVSSVLDAEKEYMETWLSKPYTTDVKYLFWAVYNIIVKKKRSA